MKKTVLITGCSSGIGLEAAKELQRNGYEVVASVRRPDQVKALKEYGVNDVRVLDVLSPNSIQNLAEQFRERPLYALINNAWQGLPGAQLDIRAEGYRQQFDYVLGTIELTKQLFPALTRWQGETARIIQVSSCLGFSTLPFRGAYCAAKAALEAHSEALRLELHQLPPSQRVWVSVVQPGPIRTHFKTNSQLALKRFVSPRKELDAAYSTLELSLDSKKTTPGTLEAKDVVKALYHALRHNKPRLYYHVTRNTRLLSLLERFAGRSSLGERLKQNMF